MMTLIGTPPNLVIQNALIEAGYERLSFFTFTPVGLVCVTVGLIVLIPLSKIFLTKKSDKEARESARISRFRSWRVNTSYHRTFIGWRLKSLPVL